MVLSVFNLLSETTGPINHYNQTW